MSKRPSLPLRDGVAASCVALPHGTWPSLVDFLAHRLPKVTREEWLARMAQGEVFDERGQPLPANAPFVPQSRVYYYRMLAAEPTLPESENVLFMDKHLVVADKPHFMPVTPKGRYVQTSLLVRLRQRLGLPELSPLHRIDRETAGLVLFAVRAQERHAYQSLFATRQLHKTYQAIAPVRDDLTFPMVRKSRIDSQERFFVSHEVAGPANSETRINLLDQTHDGDHPRGLYELEPITGKRHQLRVHMWSLSLPIEGDQFYPEVLRGADEDDDFSQPLQLLAKELRFTDPITGKQRHFKSERALKWPR
jgi:tRNA pseudouridine32 synthase/23S rRNA pseudouridine746 synthase